MTLPITESILRGELRPHLIAETVPQEKQSLLMRQLRHTADRGNMIELESDIVQALGDLTRVKETYADDKALKEAIRSLGRSTAPSAYTRVYKSVFSDILKSPDISTPILKMYKTILELEKQRTIMALVDLHTVMRDDSFIRSEAKNLLRDTKLHCKDVKAALRDGMDGSVATLLLNMLTELYFSVVHTFSSILYAHGCLDFDDEFDDFVYQWKGAYPSEEEIAKYEEKKEAIRKDKASLREKNDEKGREEEVKEQSQKRPKTSAEKFLEGTSRYGFLEMPMIRALDPDNMEKRKEKALRLVETMLSHPAHAAAMLDYLGFYQWIKEKYETGYKFTAYDNLCATLVLNGNSKAFKNYRLSLNEGTQTAEKYRAWEYKETVKDEYQAVKNDTL